MIFFQDGKNGKVTVWTKSITPEGSYAIAVLNENSAFHGEMVKFKLSDIGITLSGGSLKVRTIFVFSTFFL